MKTTYHTTGFLSTEVYCSGLPPFLEQYQERFPGLSYLHLALEEAAENRDPDPFHYYGNGRCLNIRVAKWNKTQRPTVFELYTELRSILDAAVEVHLKNHQEELWIDYYNQVKEKIQMSTLGKQAKRQLPQGN